MRVERFIPAFSYRMFAEHPGLSDRETWIEISRKPLGWLNISAVRKTEVNRQLRRPKENICVDEERLSARRRLEG
ncbi:hypothetical protein FQA47_024540 [Oryzias melastigma]|uniref:Uncharacterized protein n=1 Tax=Oryzias melastigma TaxID=30732 RepID=A0A834FLJ4_ORYME|nr:hypothetical protein FQA47_024540 [Oryzias melastigma]